MQRCFVAALTLVFLSATGCAYNFELPEEHLEFDGSSPSSGDGEIKEDGSTGVEPNNSDASIHDSGRDVTQPPNDAQVNDARPDGVATDAFVETGPDSNVSLECGIHCGAGLACVLQQFGSAIAPNCVQTTCSPARCSCLIPPNGCSGYTCTEDGGLTIHCL